MNTPNNGGEPPDLEHALEDLKTAEHDLALAHEAEHRAEDEIRKAEHEIEDALAHRETEIIVNSRPREIPGKTARFEQVVVLVPPLHERTAGGGLDTVVVIGKALAQVLRDVDGPEAEIDEGRAHDLTPSVAPDGGVPVHSGQVLRSTLLSFVHVAGRRVDRSRSWPSPHSRASCRAARP